MTTDSALPLADAISEHPLFKGLAPQYLNLLGEVAMLKDFAADEMIFREGDPANRFYVILDGEIALESSRRGANPIQLQTIGAQDVLAGRGCFRLTTGILMLARCSRPKRFSFTARGCARTVSATMTSVTS